MIVSKGIKGILIYTLVVTLVALIYYLYAYNAYPAIPERETLLGEIGEELGEIGLFALLFIYARSGLKLLLGQGPLARRLLPGYTPPSMPVATRWLLDWLDRTHIYVGIATVAIILLHIALMGLPMHILFFPIVLALVIWQGVFGLFLSWRYTRGQLRKLSYLVHAQFVTGIMIGIFAWFGHLLIDD